MHTPSVFELFASAHADAFDDAPPADAFDEAPPDGARPDEADETLTDLQLVAISARMATLDVDGVRQVSK